MEPNNTQRPTEYMDERIAELREEFALPDTFDPNTFPPTKTKGMKASISGAARNGKRFIDEGEYDTAKGYFEFFDDMAHLLNQGYYDAAVIINKLLAEIERLQKLTLAFHSADEKPEAQLRLFCLYEFPDGNRGINNEFMARHWPPVEYNATFLGWCYESELVAAFESQLKQKGAANGNV